MYDGQLIKRLRLSRKLTQGQLAEGICSKTSLVGIENGSVTKVALSSLLLILQKLNMSLAEYEELRNSMKEPIKSKYYRKSLSKVNEESFDSYKAISSNRKKYKKEKDIYFLVLNVRLLIKQTGNKIKEEHTDFLRFEYKEIEEYFMRIDEYGQFELDILTDLPFVFSDSFIENNYFRIKKKMQKTAIIRDKETMTYQFLLNLTEHYLTNGRMKKARAINEDIFKMLRQTEKRHVIYEYLIAEVHRYVLIKKIDQIMQNDLIDQLLDIIGYTLSEEEKEKYANYFNE